MAVRDSHQRLRSERRGEHALLHAPAPPPPPSAEEHLDAGERSVALDRAVSRLPPALSELYHLRSSGLSYEEMVEATGAGVSALKMRVKRASERLKVLLDEGAKVDDRP